MAKNLQANLGPRDSLALFDVNRDAMERLAADINKVCSLFPPPASMVSVWLTRRPTVFSHRMLSEAKGPRPVAAERLW